MRDTSQQATNVSHIFLRHSPGMRIIKTALAMLICVVIHYFFPVIDAINAAIAAVICLQQNIETTWRTSLNRMIGTVIAGLYAYVFLALLIYGLNLDPEGILFLTLTAIGLIPLMQILVLLKKPGAVAIAAIVFIVICLSAYRREPLNFTLYRVIDTLIGIGAAVLIDWLPPLNRWGDRFTRLKKGADGPPETEQK